MASEALRKKLIHYANDLVAEFGRNNKLPATIIGAEYRGKKKTDHSGKVPNPIAPFLKRELEKIAPLGEKGYKYRVGCCCEARASNQILLELTLLPTLKSIRFTNAIRPRTNQIINRCQNCQTVFG